MPAHMLYTKNYKNKISALAWRLEQRRRGKENDKSAKKYKNAKKYKKSEVCTVPPGKERKIGHPGLYSDGRVLRVAAGSPTGSQWLQGYSCLQQAARLDRYSLL